VLNLHFVDNFLLTFAEKIGWATVSHFICLISSQKLECGNAIPNSAVERHFQLSLYRVSSRKPVFSPNEHLAPAVINSAIESHSQLWLAKHGSGLVQPCMDQPKSAQMGEQLKLQRVYPSTHEGMLDVSALLELNNTHCLWLAVDTYRTYSWSYFCDCDFEVSTTFTIFHKKYTHASDLQIVLEPLRCGCNVCNDSIFQTYFSNTIITGIYNSSLSLSLSLSAYNNHMLEQALTILLIVSLHTLMYMQGCWTQCLKYPWVVVSLVLYLDHHAFLALGKSNPPKGLKNKMLYIHKESWNFHTRKIYGGY